MSIGYVFQAKFKSVSNRAVPDRLFINGYGVTIYIEFKATGKKLSGAQDRKAVEMARGTTPVFWVNGLEDARHLLDICKDWKLKKLDFMQAIP